MNYRGMQCSGDECTEGGGYCDGAENVSDCLMGVGRPRVQRCGRVMAWAGGCTEPIKEGKKGV